MFELANIEDIEPEGWIFEFLRRQKDGMTGHPEASGYPFNTKMWMERIELDETTQMERDRSPRINEYDGEQEKDAGIFWWPYEQTGYYIDGALKAGYLLNDSDLIKNNKKQVEYLMSTPMKDGRLGPGKLIGRWNVWPYTHIFRAFKTEYDASGNEGLIDAMHRHYLTYEASDFQDELDVTNLEHLCWLYKITKDSTLLRMAEEAYVLFKSDIKNRTRAGSDMVFESDRIPDQHGVVYFEVVKIPALLYDVTGNKSYLDEALHGIQKMEEHFMLPTGCPSTTEHFHKVDERAGFETCNHATLPYTYGIMLAVTGDPIWADKIEKAAYNAAMGAITKDFKSHQYFSTPNQMIATVYSHHLSYYPDFMAYSPAHSVACCTGNINRFMPYFAMQMWLKSKDNGVVAALFGPSRINTSVGSLNDDIIIEQKTNYPFDEKVTFKVHTERKVKFDFHVRIPAWCKNPVIKLNGKKIQEEIVPGTFYEVRRTFSDGDEIELDIPMEVELVSWASGLSIERGPILYSLAIEDSTVYETEFEKYYEGFPAYSFYPKSEWRYSLSKDVLTNVEIIKNNEYSYPWELSTPPVKLIVNARKIQNWNLEDHYDPKERETYRWIPGFPEKLDLEEETTEIELVPYGSTILRMTVFPVLKN